MLVGSRLATCGIAGVLFIAVNGYRAGSLTQNVPMVFWWAAGEIVATAFAAGSGLVLAVALWRGLIHRQPIDPDAWLAAGRSLGIAVAVLAAAAVVEVMLLRCEAR